MTKILISIFNSLFFFAITLVFGQSWVFAGLVAVIVWHITFFALCLSTLAHTSSNVMYKSDQYLQSYQDSFQFLSQDATRRAYSKISSQK